MIEIVQSLIQSNWEKEKTNNVKFYWTKKKKYYSCKQFKRFETNEPNNKPEYANLVCFSTWFLYIILVRFSTRLFATSKLGKQMNREKCELNVFTQSLLESFVVYSKLF